MSYELGLMADRGTVDESSVYLFVCVCVCTVCVTECVRKKEKERKTARETREGTISWEIVGCACVGCRWGCFQAVNINTLYFCTPFDWLAPAIPTQQKLVVVS